MSASRWMAACAGGAICVAVLSGCGRLGPSREGPVGYAEGRLEASPVEVREAVMQSVREMRLPVRESQTVTAATDGIIVVRSEGGQEIRIVYERVDDETTELAVYKSRERRDARSIYRTIARKARRLARDRQ
jgi:hypothetical protein